MEGVKIIKCASSSSDNELDEDGQSGKQQQQGSWSHWWSYDGISGPDYWSINKRWRLCSAGRLQSPVDVRTDRLVYDHLLGPIQLTWLSGSASADLLLDSAPEATREQPSEVEEEAQPKSARKLKAELVNSGRGLELWLAADQDQLILSGGPLSYAYRLYKLELHSSAGEGPASEHLIDGRAFEGELQLHFYNSRLAQSASEAHQLAQEGTASLFASLAVMVVGGEPVGGASPLGFVLDKLASLESRLELELERGQLEALVSTKSHYVAYSGSLNRPPCSEGVDWLLLNKPLRLPGAPLARRLQAHERLRANQDNLRPARPLNGRLLRTTIDNRRPPACKSFAAASHHNCSRLLDQTKAGQACSMRPHYAYQLSYATRSIGEL